MRYSKTCQVLGKFLKAFLQPLVFSKLQEEMGKLS